MTINLLEHMKRMRNLFRRSFPRKDIGKDVPHEVETTSPLQIYAGYDDVDKELIRSLIVSEAIRRSDHYVDGFGVRTLYACIPFCQPETLNLARLTLPIPDDGFHAEAIEYAALADAIHRFARHRFFAAEIGAGWGPWIGACGVIARRRRVQNLTLVGVEADDQRFELMRRHLEYNELRPPCADEDIVHDSIHTRLFKGAVWTHDGTIMFPESAVTDMGAAAATTISGLDYRGVELRANEVPCRTLQTLLGDLGLVDFLHIDIQGGEQELLREAVDWVTKNVKSMMIATHSRGIEGELVDILFEWGWKLHREKPCRVDWSHSTPTLVGRTEVDGSQYWLNGRLKNNL